MAPSQRTTIICQFVVSAKISPAATSSARSVCGAAWFFGGNATPAASLPTSGPSGTYEGAFAATAMTDNWTRPDGWA
jgi:hypothetical protein